VRVDLDLPQPTPASGASLVTLSPNDATILDQTDLVFLDAVGTGYSHAVGKASNRDFGGSADRSRLHFVFSRSLRPVEERQRL
jgi:carboxypeptidase C (cathepsin A)